MDSGSLIDLTDDQQSQPAHSSQKPLIGTIDHEISDLNQSIVNNPFDKVARQVRLLNDPFEIVLQEELIKNTQNRATNTPDVRTGRLISISDNFMSPKRTTQRIHYNSSPKSTISRSGQQVDLLKFSLTKSCVQKHKISEINNTGKISNHSANISFSNIPDDSIDLGSVTPVLIDSESDDEYDIDQLKQFLNIKTESNGSQKMPDKTDENVIEKLSKLRSTKTSNDDEIIEEASPDNNIDLNKVLSPNVQTDSTSTSRSPRQSDQKTTTIIAKAKKVINQCQDEADLKEMRIPFLENQKIDRFKHIDLNLDFFDDHSIQSSPSTSSDAYKSIKQIPSVDSSITKSSDNLSIPNDHNLESLMNNLKLVVDQCENDNVKTEASALLQNLNNVLVNQDQSNKSDALPLVKREGTFVYEESNNDIKTINDTDTKSTNIQNYNPVIVDGQSLNTIHTNINQLLQNVASNSTVILVMNQSQQPQVVTSASIPSSSDETPVRAIKTRRSKSLILNDSVTMATAASQTSTPTPVTPFRTPASHRRRVSIATPTQTEKLPMPRRSIYSIKSPSNEKIKFSPMKLSATKEKCSAIRKSLMTSSSKDLISSNPSTLKLKVGASKTAIGPLKATIPISKIVPLNPMAAMTSLTSTPLPGRSTAGFAKIESSIGKMTDQKLKLHCNESVNYTPFKSSRVSIIGTTQNSAPSLNRRSVSVISKQTPRDKSIGNSLRRNERKPVSSSGLQRFRLNTPDANKENKKSLK